METNHDLTGGNPPTETPPGRGTENKTRLEQAGLDLVTPEVGISDVFEVVEQTREPIQGFSLASLIEGAALAAEEGRLTRYGQHPNEIASATQRLRDVASQLVQTTDINILDPTTLDNFIEEASSEYGLSPEDLDLITDWYNTLETYQAKMESRYGILTKEEMRKKVANETRASQKGTWGECDLVGLKGLNEYGPRRYGDKGIEKMINFFRVTLKERFDIEHPELCLSREGDSCFFYVPGQESETVLQVVNQAYQEYQDKLQILIDRKHNVPLETPFNQPLKLIFDAIDIGPEDFVENPNLFDEKLAALSEEIEQRKTYQTTAIVETMRAETGDNPMDHITVLARYLQENKRISPQLISELFSTMYDVFQKMQQAGLTTLSKRDFLDTMLTHTNSAPIRGILKEIIAQANIKTLRDEENAPPGQSPS